MKRRLTIAILSAVAAALVLAGVGTLLFARVGVRQAAEEDLRSQAESTAVLVDLGQSRASELVSLDLSALREMVCPDGVATNPSGTLPAAQDTNERLRRAICLPPTASIDEATSRLCGNVAIRLDSVLSDDMRQARIRFCTEPTEEHLDALRSLYCGSDDPVSGLSAAQKRRFEQLRRVVCGSVVRRDESRQVLQTTLSKESIDLVQIGPQGELTPADLPSGIGTAQLQPDRLRAGDTVSGMVDNTLYAASPVDPGSPTLSVILIARPYSLSGGLVPWFLLASGLTLLIAIVVADRLSRRLTQPLAEATAVTGRIAAGDLTARLPEHTTGAEARRDEIEQLAHSINTMAEELERSHGLEQQFLLSVSHDLRTPLTSIRGYAEAIADGAAPDPERAAAVILAESRRLERLVKDLLDLAKLDAHTFTFNVAAVDLAELAADSVDGFRREVEGAGLRVVLAGTDQPVAAMADPDRLQQVIANLVENAVKFASTTVTVTVGQGPAGPWVEVADDGPGIAPEDLPHVFERLYVAAATPKRKETGSGLGLAITRELVEGMGGSIRAEGTAGGDGPGGARMVVTLAPGPAPGD